ncbi:MAG TPA: hypothetical protein VGD13_02625 [Xanthobacteraceae bacterium]|jgi:hypothetical protein
MIRFVLRFLGLWILAAAFIFLIYDGTKSIAANRFYITKVLDTWNAVHFSSLQALQPLIEQRIGSWAWEKVMPPVLNAPTWVMLGVIGILLILLGRKKKPLIGYARD